MASGQIEWLAAFFEKNGSIDAHLQRNGDRSPRIMVVATSRLLLDKIRQASGMGIITGPYRRGGKATAFRWTVVRREDMDRLIARIKPLLSKAKQEQIRQVYLQCDNKFRPPQPFTPPKPEGP